MKALLAQLDPTPDPEVNAARVCELIADHPDRELVALPELFLGGYAMSDLERRALAPGDGPLERIAAVCRDHATAVVVGFTEAVDRDRSVYANSAASFDRDGSTLRVYRKTHLFGAAEAAAFVAGAELRLVELAGVMVGPLICFDVEFPEPARRLAAAGAELLLTIAANMAPYEADHRLATRARALDNRRHHLYVNRVGEESGHRFVGRTRAIAPDGEILAELDDAEGTLAIDLDLLPPVSAAVDYLRLLRTDLPVVEDKQPGGVR
ncbi:MAG: nitrilase-related carbon-nitrogen hydrolase [Solirubrobacterales bacterium]